MKLQTKDTRRFRLTGFAIGLIALFAMAWRLASAGRASVSPTVANGFTWGTAMVSIAVILLVWRERSEAGGYRKNSEENARFIAAAETSPDALSILDSVRDKSGDVVGFRYRYVNSHAEALMKRSRNELLDNEMCDLFPTDSTRELLRKYRKVVLVGEPLSEDLPIATDGGGQRWFRRRIAKLDDGVAVTVSDVTEAKTNEEQLRTV